MHQQDVYTQQSIEYIETLIDNVGQNVCSIDKIRKSFLTSADKHLQHKLLNQFSLAIQEQKEQADNLMQDYCAENQPSSTQQESKQDIRYIQIQKDSAEAKAMVIKSVSEGCVIRNPEDIKLTTRDGII